MNQEYLNGVKDSAKKAIEHFESELNSIRTGRASTSLIEEVVVEAYGQKMALKEVASITVTDPRSMAVQPWDKGNLVQIESALRDNQLSLGVVNSGDVIRVSVPELTQERREQYVKTAKEKAEEAKISIRNARHDILEKTKKAKVAGEIAEDEMYRREEEVQKFVEAENKKIDEILAAKEKELREV